MSNKEKKNLEDFSLSQLNILLKHLGMGLDHLKLLLTPKQMKELFNWCDLKENQKKQIEADKIEKLGNMSLIINTILTSTFGAWMGLSGCIGCQLGSVKTLTFISMLAFFVSGLIGYMSLKMTNTQARIAIDNQIIHHFQLKVLKLINEKIKEKIHKAAFYLNTAIFILENKKNEVDQAKQELNVFKNQSEAFEWFEKLTAALKSRFEKVNDKDSSTLYQTQFNQITYLIKKNLAKHIQFSENLAASKLQEKKRLQTRPSLPFLKILTNPAFGIPKYPITLLSSGFQDYYYQLFLGMVPTIWGGFASMFVFVGGIPNIARELGFVDLTAFLTTPVARMIEIALAAMITSYFAFAFLYSSYKGRQRQQLLEETEKDIANQDTLLLENSHKLEMLYKVKMHTQKLIAIFTIVKKIDQNQSNREDFLAS